MTKEKQTKVIPDLIGDLRTKTKTQNMEKNKRKESYEPPKMEILEIMVEQAILQMSGYGLDSDDSDFGDFFLNW